MAERPESVKADLEQVIADPDPVQQAAAALALSDCPLTQAQVIQARYPHLQALIQAGELTWNSLACSEELRVNNQPSTTN